MPDFTFREVERSLGARNLVCLDLDISRDHPLELPVGFDPLFLAYNSIAEDARDLKETNLLANCAGP